MTGDSYQRKDLQHNSAASAEHEIEQRPIRARKAGYILSNHPLYTGNPLIDALPVVRSDAQWIAQLSRRPTFDPQERMLDSHLRSYKVALIKRIFIPTAEHRRLARRIDQMIRWGCEYRRPESPERVALLQDTYERAQSVGEAVRAVFTETQPICTSSLIGCSGMGKSTGAETVLGSYPQCLWHPKEKLVQVVWLKVDCPKNGSVSDLALAILEAFDEVLGTDYVSSLGANVKASSLLAKVSHYAVANHLGVLVLDELQNLTVKKSGGREEMLNWLQSLVNKLKIPIELLGTYKARRVLQLDMRHARRATASGSFTWDPLLKGPEFEYLLTTLWQYMWLREAGELTQELRDTIYEESQGIRGFIVDMFLVAQLHALWKGVEKITPELFRAVARTEFAPVQPMLNALRSKDPNRLKKFDDLVDFDLDSEIERLRELIPVAGADGPRNPETSMVAQASSNVESALGLSTLDAKQLVLRAVKDSHKSARALTEAAVRLYFEERSRFEGSSGDEPSPSED